MIDHLSIGSHDLPSSKGFYLPVFAALGYTLQFDTEKDAAFGLPGEPAFWIYPVEKELALNGQRTHFAIKAPSRNAVREAFAQAAQGRATVLREPAERPEITPQYYGAMFRDPDGHVIEITCMRGNEDGLNA